MSLACVCSLSVINLWPEIVLWSCSHIVITVGIHTGHVLVMASNPME